MKTDNFVVLAILFFLPIVAGAQDFVGLPGEYPLLSLSWPSGKVPGLPASARQCGDYFALVSDKKLGQRIYIHQQDCSDCSIYLWVSLKDLSVKIDETKGIPTVQHLPSYEDSRHVVVRLSKAEYSKAQKCLQKTPR